MLRGIVLRDPTRPTVISAGKRGPGPAFSSDKAEEMVQNRYRTLASTLRRTVPVLRGSSQFGRTVAALRAAGWLDWHILTAVANIVMNYRYSWTARDLRQPGARAEMLRAAFEPESDSSRIAPAALFTPHAMQQARQNGDAVAGGNIGDWNVAKRLLTSRRLSGCLRRSIRILG